MGDPWRIGVGGDFVPRVAPVYSIEVLVVDLS